MRRSMGLLCLLAFSLCLCATAKGTLKQKRSKQILEFSAKLEQGLFGEREFKKATKLLKKASQWDRPWLIMTLAQYQRSMEKAPVEGLKILAPELLGANAAKTWLAELRSAEQARKKQWLKEKSEAVHEKRAMPEKPTGLAHPFPAVAQFQAGESQAQCALEAARCLADLGKTQEALKIIDHFGKNFESDGRVLAYECLGDLYISMRMFEKSVDAFGTGLKLLKSLKATEGFSKWQKVIKKRLEDKLANAKNLWDIDRYGPGFVAYRAAETKRRKDKLQLEAIWLYDQVMEQFSKSVYYEAANLGRLKSLLMLAKRKYPGKLERNTLKDCQKTIDKEKAFYKVAKRCKVPEATLAEIKETIFKLETKLEAMKGIPFGTKALTSAKGIVRTAVEKNMWGLYRGEMLADLGLYCLMEELDPDAAGKYFKQGLAWCETAPKLDRTLQLYSIPEKASQVAAPPAKSIGQDKWGNVQYAEPKLGEILNRRTATWYLGMLQSIHLRYLGFLVFVDGDTDSAKSYFQRMGKVDERIQFLHSRSLPNMRRRLLVRCEAGAFRRATKEDLQFFKDKRRRFVVYLADFLAECEESNVATMHYRELIKGSYGKLSAEEEAYVRYGLSWSLWYAGVFESSLLKKKESIAAGQAIRTEKRLRNTRIAPRALVAHANALCYMGRKGITEALQVYRLVAKKYPNSKHAPIAMYNLAVTYPQGSVGGPRYRAFQNLIGKYPKSVWSELTRKRLREDYVQQDDKSDKSPKKSNPE